MTPHLHDARWRAAHAAHLRGDDPGVDPQWLREYQPRDPELAAERALFDALAQAEPGVEVDEDAAVAQALEQWGTEAHDIGPAPTRWVGRVAIAAGLVAAGLAAGLLLGWVGDTSPPDDTAPSLVRATKTPAPIEPSVAPAPAEATTPQSDPPAGWTVRSGQVVAEAVDEGNALPRGLALVAAGELCTASSPDREICLSDGARFEVEDDGELQLLEGRARVITRAEAVLAVTVDDVRVETQGASVYVVEHRAAGWSVTVEDGTAVVQEGPTRRALDAGATARGGGTHDSSRAPTPPPSVRLARARARRAQGDLRGAAKIYEALIATSPRSAPARAATVSLGQLYLELGQPKRALGAFERYLGRGSKGPLTEDAAYGRLRALRALGRTKSLKRHADRFLAEHPKSAYASRVQRWAE